MFLQSRVIAHPSLLDLSTQENRHIVLMGSIRSVEVWKTSTVSLLCENEKFANVYSIRSAEN